MATERSVMPGTVLGRLLNQVEALQKALEACRPIIEDGVANADMMAPVDGERYLGAQDAIALADAASCCTQSTFQAGVWSWLLACFGDRIAQDRMERNHRFLEESLELVQACGASREEALQLVDYVFGRPVGEKHQEVGGVMVTLAALCGAQGLDMCAAGEQELCRIQEPEVMERIRAKQATKPKGSPLPETAPPVGGAR